MQHVDIICGMKCNLNCNFCLGSPSTEAPLLSYDVIKTKLIDYRLKKYSGVCFNGGEPLLHSQIVELVSLAKYLGYSKIMIQTNGKNLPNIIDLLHNSGLTHLGITHTSHFDYKTLEMIPIDIGVYFDIVLSKEILKNVVEIVKLIKKAENNVVSLNLKFPYVGGNAKKYMGEVIPRYEEVVDIIRQLDLTDLDYAIHYIPICLLESLKSRSYMMDNDDLLIDDGKFSFKLSKSVKRLQTCRNCKYYDDCSSVPEEYLELYGLPKLKNER
jgi:MoaA/NifB/PqqE/SkfB family radical SAM enzyme